MKTKFSKRLAQFGVSLGIVLLCVSPGWAALQLEDRPTNVMPPPPNMLFTPSVEYPTMVEVAHKESTYASEKEYLGYFDPKKCYDYVDDRGGYFTPVSVDTTHSCNGKWSGNALNYATMGGMDTFRWALTGGSRAIDEGSSAANPGGVTILRRSYQSLASNGKLSGRSIRSNTGSWVSPDSVGQGEKMVIGYQSYNVRVRVCHIPPGKDETFLESNCAAYKDPAKPEAYAITYKPVGLIQRYQSKIRFGVFSYLLNRDANGNNIGPSTGIDGAVLRARLKNVGPLTWENETNSGLEWSTIDGTFVKNPDTADANSSYGGAVSKSGVINYLNDFGFDSKSYQTLDQPSEMYAEALRYLMHKSPTYSYYSQTTAHTREGFPVIKDWWKNGHDSVLSYCQKTSIVGIGDINTHHEENDHLGSDMPDVVAWMKKINETIVPDDTGALTPMAPDLMCWGYGHQLVDVVSGYNIPSQFASKRSNIIVNPTITWNGYKITPTPTNPKVCSNGGGNKIAGLAYWAHTNDLRPDLTAGKDRKITVDTYWVDVLEPTPRAPYSGSPFSEYTHKNQYWLAAKYGGTKANERGDDQWWKNKRYYRGNTNLKLPDNYYPAGDPKAMIEGLESIFAEIGVETPGTGAGAGWVSNDVSGNVTDYYLTRYSPVDWSGSLEAYGSVSFNPDGSVSSTKLWDAADKITHQNWNTGRRIVTYARQLDGSYQGIPFRFEQLTTAQKNALGGDDPTRRNVLNYLRGDRANEISSGYRERKTLLGDIVHSKPTEVGAPSAGYSDAKNPGYSDFKNTHKDRAKVVYVGANDGMLHAINGVGSPNAGEELWAYIPSFLFEGPDNPKDPEISGLRALTRSTYSHHYYVDATPMVRDVDFARTGGKLESFDNSKTPDWHTILVSGLGKGGKGFFALDVTSPTITDESAAASKVLWEFPQLENPDPDVLADISDMGFSFGRPLITKTKAWGWVVILTSGYNNDSGKGVLYVLNAKTGEKLARVETGVGSANQEAGFAQVSGYTQAYADYTTDQIYGGDLLGNLWRFDLTGDSGSIPAPDKIAEFRDGSNAPQPVTAAPIVEVIADASSPVNGSRWIAVGTGQWLSASDITKGTGTQTQTMYAIRDGKDNATGIASGTTQGRGDLTHLASTGSGLNSIPDNGWYYDMGGNIGLSKERVTFAASFVPNTLVWTGIIPRGVQDECNIEVPKGKSRIYAVDLATGKTKLSSGVTDGYYEINSLAVGQDIVQSGDEYKVVVTDSEGKVLTPPDPVAQKAAGGLSRSGVINWRTVE